VDVCKRERRDGNKRGEKRKREDHIVGRGECASREERSQQRGNK